MSLRDTFIQLVEQRAAIFAEAARAGLLWPPPDIPWPRTEGAQRYLCAVLQASNPRICSAVAEYIAEFGLQGKS